MAEGKSKTQKPTRAVVIRKYVGTESMETVFKEIVSDEIRDSLEGRTSEENEIKDESKND